MIGIYKITNKINGKIYVGQSGNIKLRWKNHKNHKKTKNLICLAFNKYGIENFEFKVIEECSIEKLNEREIYWIKYYDSFNFEKGYNMTPGGNSNGMSEKTKKKISEAQRKKSIDGLTYEERRYNKRKYHLNNKKEWIRLNRGTKVICLETGESFDSYSDAAEKYNVTNAAICMAANGKRKTAANLHWKRM